jgi:hypothetical protein
MSFSLFYYDSKIKTKNFDQYGKKNIGIKHIIFIILHTDGDGIDFE